MAWKKKLVYVVTAWFRDFEDGYSEPYDEFYAESLDEAEKLQSELYEFYEYEDVCISDFLEEREILV